MGVDLGGERGMAGGGGGLMRDVLTAVEKRSKLKNESGG